MREGGLGTRHRGDGIGRPLPHPETVLANYDLVFAKARAALEAMAVGAAVVLCGPRGLGPLVTPDNWDRLRLLNFGVRSLSLPMNVQNVLSEIARYDAGGAAAVSTRVRSKATLHDAVDQLLALYKKAIQDTRIVTEVPAGEIAAARYLRSHAVTFKGRATSNDCLADVADSGAKLPWVAAIRSSSSMIFNRSATPKSNRDDTRKHASGAGKHTSGVGYHRLRGIE